LLHIAGWFLANTRFPHARYSNMHAYVEAQFVVYIPKSTQFSSPVGVGGCGKPKEVSEFSHRLSYHCFHSFITDFKIITSLSIIGLELQYSDEFMYCLIKAVLL